MGRQMTTGAALTEAAAMLAAALLPVFVNPYSTRSFEPDKVALVQVLVLLAGLGWVLDRFSSREPPVRKPSPGSGRLFLWLALAWLLVLTVATVLSVAPRTSFWGSYERGQGLLSAVAYVGLALTVAPRLRRSEVRARLLTAVELGSLVVALDAVVRGLGWIPVRGTLLPSTATESGERIGGTLGNPNFLAGYLILVLPLTAARLGQSAEQQANRWVAFRHIGLLSVQLGALWFTGSRSGWLGLLAGTGAGMLALLTASDRRRLATGFLLLSGLAVALLVGTAVRRPLGAPETPGLARLLALSPATTTGAQRQQLWAGTVALLRARPLRALIGYGPETLDQVYGPYYPPALAEFEPDGQVRFPDRAHNLLLDVIVFAGAPGLVALLTLWGSGFALAAQALGLSATRSLVGGGLGLAFGAAAGWLFQRSGALMGLGAVLGGVGGLLIGLTLAQREEVQWTTRSERRWLGAALFAMLVAHSIETAFGFPTASSTLLFWLGLAMLAGLGEIEADDSVVEASMPMLLLGSLVATLAFASLPLTRLRETLLWVAVWLVGLLFLAPPRSRLLWGLPLTLLPLLLVLTMTALPPMWAVISYFCSIAVLVRATAFLSISRGMCRQRAPWAAGLLVVAGLAWLLVLRPLIVDVLHRQGVQLAAEGQVEAGMALVERTVRLLPDRQAYRLRLSKLYQTVAVRSGNASIRDDWMARGVYLLSSLFPRYQGDWLRAWADMTEDTVVRQVRLREALLAYEAALARAPGDVQAKVGMGQVLDRLADFAAAEQVYSGVEAVAPRYFPLYVAWTHHHLALGQVDAALAVAEQGVTRVPWAGPAYQALAEARLRRGDLLAASQAAVEGLARSPEDYRGWWLLSRIRQAMGDSLGADAAAQQARELRPPWSEPPSGWRFE
ncbi:MAG TPA: hypothetical protein EYH31_09235 [Anaerolineae bacterium]|nr:hypothetical protein [Anaerolineae bacterium]